MMDEKILKIQHTLKKELDENRYHHTLDVHVCFNGHALRCRRTEGTLRGITA